MGHAQVPRPCDVVVRASARAFACQRAPVHRAAGVTLGVKIVDAIWADQTVRPPLLDHRPRWPRNPEVRTEIFGNGGYRSVTDLKRALAPLGGGRALGPAAASSASIRSWTT